MLRKVSFNTDNLSFKLKGIRNETFNTDPNVLLIKILYPRSTIS